MENKSKNLWLIIGVVAVIIIVAVLLVFKPSTLLQPQTPGTHEAPPEIPLEQQIPGNLPNQTPSAQLKPGEQAIEIIYTDAGFAPQTLTIKAGQTVSFKNLSSAQMWPASAVHPAHDSYTEKGGCIGSKFDACRGVNPNESWAFRFTYVGTWQYHDHLSPSHTGTIVVQK